MGFFTALAGYAAPMFLVFSPILSYGDQAISMNRNRSSAGFSLDIPLIMLVASLMRIFYYPGAHFDVALLIQSIIMVAVQLALLKIALDHRPSPSAKGGDAAVPFASARQNEGAFAQRPFNFWQWRSPKPYWHFLLYLFLGLSVCELLFSPFKGLYAFYSSLIGYVGLSVEAVLPLPQIRANARARSCQGFRPSVLVNWLAGDAMKMFWFFTSTTEIPWPFKLCGLFQASCDTILGIQYFVYGNGAPDSGSSMSESGAFVKLRNILREKQALGSPSSPSPWASLGRFATPSAMTTAAEATDGPAGAFGLATPSGRRSLEKEF